MSSEIITLVRTQTIQCGLDAKIRTTDTDVDNMFDALASPALPLTRVHLFAQISDTTQGITNRWHHIFAIYKDLTIPLIAQSGVQNGTIFRAVDLLTGEHGRTLLCEARLLRQSHQASQHRLASQMAGVVERQASGIDAHALGTAGFAL